ncbi:MULTISPECIES: hypothetical protein [Chryseobacterium]|uniref:hypothetical protein n=1 Tax=Chryseobacterium TaxID=59732 RepID=UPI001296A5AA|nr:MULTISPECIES: hypothetical protein [Chryseobacterium]MDR6923565.1 heme/copper-type cytochrome/quinol oxidase subunit 2 [Chryseobacterium sp. 2987]
MNTVKRISPVLSAFLLLYFLYQLKDMPGGGLFSGIFVSVVILVMVIGLILFLSFILSLIFRKTKFISIVFLTSIPVLIVSCYKLYSPTLKIIVPKGYSGEINLVLSKLSKNELTVDSNGIGYITQWTFDKTYTRPEVYDTEGKNLDNRLISYDKNKFWGQSFGGGNTIKSLSFEINKDSTELPLRSFKVSDWLRKVDMNKVYLEHPEQPVENILEVRSK